METNAEILELKFEGNGINPSKVRASEVAELISSFEGAILAIVKENHPELKEDYVLISFEEIKNQSLSIKNLAHDAGKYVIPAYLSIIAAFNTNNFNGLPLKTIDDLRTFTRFAKRHNCDGSFIRGNIQDTSFQPNTEIVIDDSRYIRGETTLYGILQRVGGEDPRTTIKVNDDYTISFEVKKEIAIQLATKLYSEVGLIGTAKWDKYSYRIVDFRADGIINFDAKPIPDTFKELNSIMGKYIKDIDSFDSFINEV